MPQLDLNEFKKFLRLYMDLLKRVEIEATAYRNVVETLRTASENPLLDDLLQYARQNPTMLKMVEDKYQRHMATMIARIDAGSLDQALEEFLRDWKPEGPIN